MALVALAMALVGQVNLEERVSACGKDMRGCNFTSLVVLVAWGLVNLGKRVSAW